MPTRLKLTIAYDGNPFDGWQSQPSGNAVQDHIEKAFTTLCRKPVRIHGAGRTDAGVHALRQCAHVDIESTRSDNSWRMALNGNLPSEIRVTAVRQVPATFHARFSAKGKVYRYRIWNNRILSPLELGRVWHVPGPLDLEAVKAAAKVMEGQQDFAAFAANRGKPDENTIRNISKITVRKEGSLVTLTFTGDGFLYKMVRLLTGALARCGQDKMTLDDLQALFQSGPDGNFRYCAPAEGLCMMRVLY